MDLILESEHPPSNLRRVNLVVGIGAYTVGQTCEPRGPFRSVHGHARLMNLNSWYFGASAVGQDTRPAQYCERNLALMSRIVECSSSQGPVVPLEVLASGRTMSGFLLIVSPMAGGKHVLCGCVSARIG